MMTLIYDNPVSVIDKVTAETLINKLHNAEYRIVVATTLGWSTKKMCEHFNIVYGTLRKQKQLIKAKLNNLPPWGWPLLLIQARGTDGFRLDILKKAVDK